MRSESVFGTAGYVQAWLAGQLRLGVFLRGGRALLALCHSVSRRTSMLRAMRLGALFLSAALVASACAGGDDSASETTTSTVPTTTTAVLLSSVVWSRVSHDEVVFGGVGMQSVTAAGPGLVAVGFNDPLDDFDAIVWTSPDGVTWSRVPDAEGVFSGAGDQKMVSVTAGGSGLVAVGLADTDAAVWTSPDGITWSRVPHDEPVFAGLDGGEMLSVTAGGPGVVAVGWDLSGDPTDAAVWTSPDGVTWSRVPDAEEVFGGAGDEGMASVAAGGPGLVAVGWDESGDGLVVDAAVWTSPDGITWSRVPHNAAVFGRGFQVMLEVTVGGPGLVAVGFDVPGAAVWTAVAED